MKTKFDRMEFWKDPTKSKVTNLIPTCRPEFYLDLHNISAMVLDVMERYAQKTWSILEIGCGTGRNLVALKQAGYKKVRGIELSKRTIEVGRARFPEYESISVINAPVEDSIRQIRSSDVIYTSGLLMHLPYEADWVLNAISRKARHLIMTNESEISSKIVHYWRRDYQAVFEALGWRQVEMTTGDMYPPLSKATIKRVFLRAE